MKIYTSKIKNNRIFDKNIVERKIKDNNENNDFYPYFLKRKRIEKGMKLEDVASGICSISYLSRIENNQMIPNEDNLKLLFERLDLDYETIKRNREENIFEETLKKELLIGKNDLANTISDAIKSRAYTGIELDLLILYKSILDKSYEEARYILSKQEMNLELFNNNETIFYLYLFCRYLFETNQNRRAYSQIKVLNSIQLNNNFLKSIIYDLTINLAFVMGDYEQVVKFYYMLTQNEYSYLYTKKMTFNKLRMLVASSNFTFSENIEEIQKLKKTVDLEIKDNYTEYYYLVSISYYNNSMYEDALESIKKIKDNSKYFPLYGFLLKRVGKDNDIKEYIKEYKNIEFSKYESLHKEFSEYIMLALKNENSYNLFAYVKQKVLSQNSLFYDHIINDMALKELLDVGTKSSKYKETLKYISDSSN